MTNEQEIARLAAAYGEPLRAHHDLEIGPSLFYTRFTKHNERRGEVVFALEQPDGRILLHRKTHYRPGIYRLPSGRVHPDGAVSGAFQVVSLLGSFAFNFASVLAIGLAVVFLAAMVLRMARGVGRQTVAAPSLALLWGLVLSLAPDAPSAEAPFGLGVPLPAGRTGPAAGPPAAGAGRAVGSGAARRRAWWGGGI